MRKPIAAIALALLSACAGDESGKPIAAPALTPPAESHAAYRTEVSSQLAPLYPTDPVTYRPAVAPMVEEVAKLDSAGESAVGFSGAPHDFYLIRQRLAKVAIADDYKSMLRDPRVLVRAMAIQGLADNFPAEAPPLIEPRRRSRVSFDYYPGGCGRECWTESQFATMMLDHIRPIGADEQIGQTIVDMAANDYSHGLLQFRQPVGNPYDTSNPSN